MIIKFLVMFNKSIFSFRGFLLDLDFCIPLLHSYDLIVPLLTASHHLIKVIIKAASYITVI